MASVLAKAPGNVNSFLQTRHQLIEKTLLHCFLGRARHRLLFKNLAAKFLVAVLWRLAAKFFVVAARLCLAAKFLVLGLSHQPKQSALHRYDPVEDAMNETALMVRVLVSKLFTVRQPQLQQTAKSPLIPIDLCEFTNQFRVNDTLDSVAHTHVAQIRSDREPRLPRLFLDGLLFVRKHWHSQVPPAFAGRRRFFLLHCRPVDAALVRCVCRP
jgi:hypothetical protein